MTPHMMCVTRPASPATKPMFVRILTSALIAGASAGFLAALLQLAFVQPVLLQAELFESGALAFSPGMAVPNVPFAFDLQRDGLSILFTMLIYSGYGLILVALMSLSWAMRLGVSTMRESSRTLQKSPTSPWVKIPSC